MRILKCVGKSASILITLAIIAYALLTVVVRPSNDRDWNLDQAVLPEIKIADDTASIKNIRNFEYRTTTDYTPRYYDAAFDLNAVNSVWFMVEPFSDNPGAAHTLLSFGFDDGRYVSISVEIRKEKGESFSAVKGLLRRYELMYVVADERDVIKLRSNYRRDQVYLYPMKATREQARALFVDMLERAQKLQVEPEFYNTLTSTCTTNIVRHVNGLADGRIPFDYRILLPGYSDRYAYELGLIDTDLSFDEARARFNINERAERHADNPEFSRLIRE